MTESRPSTPADAQKLVSSSLQERGGIHTVHGENALGQIITDREKLMDVPFRLR